jgi:hypothetical protein
MEAGNVLMTTFVVVILILVSVYLMYTIFADPSYKKPNVDVPPGTIQSATFHKEIVVEIYCLLPEFLLGELECLFNIGINSYPEANRGVRVENIYRQDKFNVDVYTDSVLSYTIRRIDDSKVVHKQSIKLTYDILRETDHLYLCDGEIVNQNNFLPDFGYRFAGLWPNKQYQLFWSSPIIKNVITDSIEPESIPTSLTTPYSYNELLTSETAGWKGAWMGMVWTLKCDGKQIGQLTITSTKVPVLVAIYNKGLIVSST